MVTTHLPAIRGPPRFRKWRHPWLLYPHVNPAIDCTPAIITGPKFEQDLPLPFLQGSRFQKCYISKWWNTVFHPSSSPMILFWSAGSCTMEVGNLNNSWETKRHPFFSKGCLSSSLGFLETPVSLKELGPCWVEKLVELDGILFWKKILSYLILLLKWLFWSKICILLVYSHPDVLEGILFCHSVILNDQIRI